MGGSSGRVGTLADTGLDSAIERMLAPPFIVNERYGTRSTTVVMIDRSGELRFVERSFDRSGGVTGEERFVFTMEPAGAGGGWGDAIG